MLSSVLNSERAVQVNIAIMRAFVRLRQVIAAHADLARKIDELEKQYREHDSQFQVVFHAIRELLEPPLERPKRQIGFKVAPNACERSSRSGALVRYPERANR